MASPVDSRASQIDIWDAHSAPSFIVIDGQVGQVANNTDALSGRTGLMPYLDLQRELFTEQSNHLVMAWLPHVLTLCTCSRLKMTRSL
jgi:hypothetical protein